VKKNESRRLSASTQLEEYIRTNLPDVKVIVLGDLNDELTDVQSVNVSGRSSVKPTNINLRITGSPPATLISGHIPPIPAIRSHSDYRRVVPSFRQQRSAITPLLIENFISAAGILTP
jgi:hypothetical protein